MFDDGEDRIQLSIIGKDKSKKVLGWTRSEDSAKIFIEQGAYGLIQEHHRIILAERIKGDSFKPFETMIYRRKKNGKMEKMEVGGQFGKRD